MAESLQPHLDAPANRRARRFRARIEVAHERKVGHDGDGGRRREPRRPAEPLGRSANKSSPPHSTPEERRERKHAKRRERHSLRYRLRQVTTLKRVKDCGHVSINGEGSGPALRLGVGKGGRIAGFSGLAHCGSVWACPVCSAKIATRRAEELADLMRYALEQGCTASMVTLTMRHNQRQSLADCWEALSKAWARVTSGKQWVSDQATAGLQGWVKAVEVTRGKNGWHVHLHVLMIWRGEISEDMAKHVGGRMHARWTRALQRRGFDSWRDSGGLDVRLATLDPVKGGGLHEYFVKLSHEITGGQAKLARGGGRTPFQLLTEGLATGLADDIERWWEWEKASRGRRQIAWSKGLREWAKVEPEQSDEEIVEEELPGEELLLIRPDSWRALRSHPDRVCELLEAAEAGGFAGAAALLDDWGLAWMVGRSAPPPLTKVQLDAYRAFPRQLEPTA
ncbi:protein rep [Pseudonocardia broussonetiae]|uniref:Protein rep n=1 Tax=Pseudonocardia broussonetiae TaxID=2736640 RepID=A0A6M6JXC4_9PSEU|nr:protein rep [Pseudonocardia broussonetiae]QJY51209.1 protein rep [Pseudonocardia broussonetiae]QJY51222.1 protein rep [Pseudonocardia broussonetiae]